jgi:hypothetical protein
MGEGRWLLPTPDNAVSKRLPEEERRLLEPALFDTGSIRRVTAGVLANAKAARSHTDLCAALANSSALSKKLEPASVASLPAFSRLADAAMHAVRGLWDQINHDETKQSPTVEKLARSTELQSRFDLLRDASVAWLCAPLTALCASASTRVWVGANERVPARPRGHAARRSHARRRESARPVASAGAASPRTRRRPRMVP